jgi:aminoglycoside 3-N-acetyltransferase
VRNHLPVFDRQTTPTEMGAIPEAFRTWPGTLRSDHPLESVCARGALAPEITGEHPLAFSEGQGGPFGKLYRLDAWILLLGVGFNRCTALHFAESLVEKRRVATVRFPVLDSGCRVWRDVSNVADDNDTHFPIVGHEYVARGKARPGLIGEAPSTLFPMRDLVDFAVRYFETAL